MSSLMTSRALNSTRRRAIQHVRRSLSTASSKTETESSSSSSSSPHPEPQPFVQTRIHPGEWDPETRTNPLYRPKFRSQAKIWSADDFSKQPTVGFTDEYENFAEAAVTLSWLTAADQKQIYQLYLEIMEAAADKPRTSHEYVVRVIAQKFRLTPERVAGVIQLQHNEEQLIRQKNAGVPDINLCEEAADFMDNSIQQEIRDAYQAFGEKKPDEFVEDPIMFMGQERKTWQVVDDVFDVDQLLKDATVREEREARLAIDGYVYVEDVDDDTVELPLSKDCKELLRRQANFKKGQEKVNDEEHQPESNAVTVTVPEENATAENRRPRWKYVAQVVNTRELYRQKHHDGIRTDGPMSYTNNSPENTLVEVDGTLRRATKADVQQTSWKSVRHTCEHTYRTAKQGWLNRKIRGDMEAWGKAPKAPPVAAVKKEEKEELVVEEDEEEAAVVEEEAAEAKEDTASEGDISTEDSSTDAEKQEEAKKDEDKKE